MSFHSAQNLILVKPVKKRKITLSILNLEIKMKTLFQALVVLLMLSSSLVFADSISVENPYVREVPPGQLNSASFMILNNSSNKDIALIKASSDVAANVEIHEHINQDGMKKMRQVKQIDVKANDTTLLKPGGYHVMLIGLTRKIKAGDIIDITLEFDNGEKKAIKAEVKKIMAGMMMKGKHGMMDNKKMKQHLNPMPNLMMVFKKMPETLNLTPEQTEQLNAGIKERSPKIKDLFATVTKYEKEILDAALADKPLEDLDQLANNIIHERHNIINAKAGCADSVKGIMTKEQFANLQKIYKEKFAKKPNYTDGKKGKMAMLKHVNPMPNLMLVVKKMGDKLDLSEKQATKLKQWREERGPIMDKQYKTIIKLESELQDAALNNASHEKLLELADGIMQNRIKVMRGKAFCRNKMKEILKPEQYKKVLTLYKENFMM